MRLAGIFAAFAGRPIQGVKRCQRFPEPVGAITSACSPRAATCQVPDWTAVGRLKARRNQSRVAGENRPAGAMKVSGICH
ncbi:hypothetical protein ACULNC_12960 [Shigella flexneri]